MGIREKYKHYIPVLIGIIYATYFYIINALIYRSGWLISLQNVSASNIGIKLFGDFATMLILPLLLIIFNRNKLNELGINKSKISVVLALIYVLFFVLHNDYTINGIYKAFFYLFIVALPEEIIFRGYAYNSLKKNNRISAIIISGIFFGIMHSILPSIISESSILTMIKDMFNQLGGGIVSGFIFILYLEKSNSIFVPILIHALLDYSYNALGILVAILVLVYLFIINRGNKTDSKITYKHLVKKENLSEEDF